MQARHRAHKNMFSLSACNLLILASLSARDKIQYLIALIARGATTANVHAHIRRFVEAQIARDISSRASIVPFPGNHAVRFTIESNYMETGLNIGCSEWLLALPTSVVRTQLITMQVIITTSAAVSH